MGAAVVELRSRGIEHSGVRARRADPDQPGHQLHAPGISWGGHVGGLIGGSLAARDPLGDAIGHRIRVRGLALSVAAVAGSIAAAKSSGAETSISAGPALFSPEPCARGQPAPRACPAVLARPARGCRMCASSSRPSTSRGPGREKYPEALTATTCLRADIGQLACVGERLSVCALLVIATRHHHQHIRRAAPRPPRRSPARVRRACPARPHRPQLDQLRCPVPGHEHRIEPLERGDPRARLSRTASFTRSIRAAMSATSVSPGRAGRWTAPACARHRASRRASSGRARSPVA